MERIVQFLISNYVVMKYHAGLETKVGGNKEL